MVRILLTRHGHVAGIDPPTFRGGEIPLSERGLQEARLTAERIARRWQVSQVYTSPRQRCVHTGEIIAAACGVPCEPLRCLNDLDYGAWSGHSHQAIERAHPEAYERWRRAPDLVRFPEGNTLQELSVGVADALRVAIGRHPDGTVVIVAHDSSNRVLLLQVLGLPLSSYWRLAQFPCALNEILIDAHGCTVLRMNDTAHLEALS